VAAVRLAVYTDYAYRRDGEGVWAERAFALFLGGLAERLGGMKVIGRLDPRPGETRYRLADGIEFVPLPFYESLANPAAALAAMARSVAVFWRALDDVDAVWLLGPHPLALAAAAIALLRRRRVVLGVRQDLPEYTRARHHGRRALRLASSALDLGYRALARTCPVVVVGPALARRYGAAGHLLEIAVSLVHAADLADAEAAGAPGPDGETRVLSVGRLEREKDPLLLADVLARLREAGERDWRLVVQGEGPLEGALAARLEELGVAHAAELRGYARHSELLAAYREASLLLHSSATEGFPQVIVEALAAALPVVASDVGGIREAVGEAVTLVAPGDAEAAAGALEQLASDPDRRERQVRAGLAYARAHTMEAELDRLTAFLQT
jgi:glycosyltransferase involved in cell wall biosynthesis